MPSTDGLVLLSAAVEVENALYEHPAVAETALIGLPHRTLGEVPVAIVRLRSGMPASEQELRARVAAQLAAFKVPERIAFSAEALPRNPQGKILKRELQAKFRDHFS